MQKLRGFLIVLALLAGLGLVFDTGASRRVVIVLVIASGLLFSWAFQFNRVSQFDNHSGTGHWWNAEGVRKVMGWFFAYMSLRYMLDPRVSMLYAIHRHYALLPFRNLVTFTLYVAVPIISGVAWWTVWKRKPSARLWGIAASVTYILIFLRPIVFFPTSAWWRNWGVLGEGIIGLIVFLPRYESHDSETPTPSDAAAEGNTWLKLS
jgi:hypothetical protein